MAEVRPKLETVEAARGIAALAVVVFHTNAAALFIGHDFFAPFSAGEHGVDFFFVLSGFIIFFAHGDEIGDRRRARDYVVKRFIRLFPILWIVAGSGLLAKAMIGEPVSLSVAGTSLFLYPSLERPYPLVLWTLRHELLFYLAFLVLIISRKAGAMLFGVWTAACLVQLGAVASGHPIEGVAAFLASSYHLDFIMGAALAAAHNRWNFSASPVPLLVGIALVVTWVVIEQTAPFHRHDVVDYLSLPAVLGTLCMGTAFTIVLHGLLRIEPIVKVPKVLIDLGSASYAIYLIHTPLNSLSQRLAVFLPSGLSHLFIAAIGVAGGVALHRWGERPLSESLRRRWLRPRIAPRQTLAASALPCGAASDYTSHSDHILRGQEAIEEAQGYPVQ